MTNNKNYYGGKIGFWIRIIVLIYLVAGILFYFFQEKFLLHPVPLAAGYTYHFDKPFNEINIPLSRNENINIVKFLPKDSIRKGVVLYFHGNSENINHYASAADNFTKKGFEVWMPDYPGFGKSTGTLTEAKLYELASLIYSLAISRFSKDNIIIYGRSFGSGVACELASVQACRLLILETPYYSIPDLLSCYAPIYPMNIISKFKLPSFLFLQSVKAPVVIFHGTADKVIPYKCALKLKGVLKPTDQFITIQGGGHNNLNDFEVLHIKINNLLAN